MTQDDLGDLTFGVLQLKRARSYAEEHCSTTNLANDAGGARFHGCRSHISLAIWFLTHQQWQTQQRHMPSVECKNLATDSIQISDFYDSSDDDDSQPYSLA
ncbi:unnamed protein product [Rotaria magnacalcarata]|uniref:Uncharacterized protein n=1 Tax=Rotaria magnacalcarata TaxID=392030 RepID=A0A819MTU1_9BILA|nr:unnamed protein product [Rotaria magnacalcarata]CAF3904794.1 unnamed protein product [Rotaria magnacalcarata]CAF3986030.1 unnamed protein product [Rotaria magnacalcarata]CAF4022207.1 unnamed protein product [Rotaria magnacalcarata]CAF4291198.1 unnamed protein product [Rotaria magnacalcarata]